MSDEDVLAAYRQTSWTVDAPNGLLVVRPGERITPGALPLPAGVVTAFNPRSELRPRNENRRANQALARELAAWGSPARAALARGDGPDAPRWDEPGFLVVGRPLEEVVRLAARYDQNAVLWIGLDGVPVIVSARRGFAGSLPGAVL